MKKLLFNGSIFCLFFVLYACNEKNNGGEQQSPLGALLASGGKLQTTEAKSEVTTLSCDTLAVIPYKEPASDMQYDAIPVKTVKRYSVVDNPMEFVTLDPWDMLWPGALIQGASLRDGVPASIPIYSKRQPGRIYLSLLSGTEDMDEWYKEVPMRGSEVMQAMNTLLSKYLGSGIPARTSFEIKTVSSVEELALKMGINLSLFGAKLKSEFGNSWSQDKTYVAVKLNQLFFTMTYEGPDGGFVGAFTRDITVDDLKGYTGTNNPICYVASVSYGRSFILLYESSKSARTLEFALSAAYNGFSSVTNMAAQKEVINSATCKMVQIGGDPQAGLETVFGDFSKIRDFVVNGATISSTNVGAPLSYKIVHLLDNTPARLTNTLEYEASNTEYLAVYPRNNVVIDIFNVEMPKEPYTDRKLSNHSNMRVKELWLTCGTSKYVKSFDTEAKGTKGVGANIPLYTTYVLENVPKTDRIVLHCVVTVKNQTYGGPTIVKEMDIVLEQQFEYNFTNNKWQPVEKKHAAFASMSLPRTLIGDAWTELQLNYRFACDGKVYTYAEDGR